MTRDQLEKLEAALADVPEKFITGTLYIPGANSYCLLGWLGKKLGAPVEDAKATCEWAAQRVGARDYDLLEVIACAYGLPGNVYEKNDLHSSRTQAPWPMDYGIVDARAVAAYVLEAARAELAEVSRG